MTRDWEDWSLPFLTFEGPKSLYHFCTIQPSAIYQQVLMLAAKHPGSR